MNLKNIPKHFHTITAHKLMVMRHCFQCGLIRQGLLHDLSKYSPTEFWIGVKYYQGTCSPNNAERKDKGYSSAWLHHKGRNKHHIEYWIDYSLKDGELLTGCEMPLNYVYEMFCDRVAASKIYNGKNYKITDPLDYYYRSRDHYLMHPNTQKILEQLLQMLVDKGEKETFSYIRSCYKQYKKHRHSIPQNK